MINVAKRTKNLGKPKIQVNVSLTEDLFRDENC